MTQADKARLVALLEILQRDRYSLELAGHGQPPHCERCYRQAWNDSSGHAERLVTLLLDSSDDGSAAPPAVHDSSDGSNAIERGLAELVENAPEPAKAIEFDVGGEG